VNRIPTIGFDAVAWFSRNQRRGDHQTLDLFGREGRRSSLSMSHRRVPMGPRNTGSVRELPMAYATAMVSL